MALSNATFTDIGSSVSDIFAGIGINAGPSLGTTAAQIGSVPSGVTATTVAAASSSTATAASCAVGQRR